MENQKFLFPNAYRPVPTPIVLSDKNSRLHMSPAAQNFHPNGNLRSHFSSSPRGRTFFGGNPINRAYSDENLSNHGHLNAELSRNVQFQPQKLQSTAKLYEKLGTLDALDESELANVMFARNQEEFEKICLRKATSCLNICGSQFENLVPVDFNEQSLIRQRDAEKIASRKQANKVIQKKAKPHQ